MKIPRIFIRYVISSYSFFLAKIKNIVIFKKDSIFYYIIYYSMTEKNTKRTHHSEKKNVKNTEKAIEKKITEMSHEAKEKFDEASVVIKKEAKVVEKQGKKILGSVSAWWDSATSAERVSMILWIIVLLIGLWLLRGFVVGIVLILLGVMWITGFFVKKDE